MYIYIERDIHIDRAIASPIVLHIGLLIPIVHYCAVLPVPGPEDGGVVETMFLTLLRLMGPALFL